MLALREVRSLAVYEIVVMVVRRRVVELRSAAWWDFLREALGTMQHDSTYISSLFFKGEKLVYSFLLLSCLRAWLN